MIAFKIINTYQIWIMNPFPINKILKLVFTLRQFNNCFKFSITSKINTKTIAKKTWSQYLCMNYIIYVFQSVYTLNSLGFWHSSQKNFHSKILSCHHAPNGRRLGLSLSTYHLNHTRLIPSQSHCHIHPVCIFQEQLYHRWIWHLKFHCWVQLDGLKKQTEYFKNIP